MTKQPNFISQQLVFEQISTDLPMDLLLLADEFESAIATYIHKCVTYTAKLDGETVAVCAVLRIDELEVEIKNIAVAAEFQQHGIGKKFIHWVENLYATAGYTSLLVATGDASIFQLLFYQKCGFEMDSIRKNHFLTHYEKPVMENGVQLRHQVVLKKAINRTSIH
jgi:aminoglycoside 6'-N-acetyltransferase I